MKPLGQRILSLSEAIRYVAVYQDGKLTTDSKHDLPNSSSAESDKYEELIVNPTLIALLTQRGNIDCGGLKYALIRYGSFYVYVRAYRSGHVTAGIELNADPMQVIDLVEEGLGRFGP